MDNHADETFACDLETRLDNFFEDAPPKADSTAESCNQPSASDSGNVLNALKSAVLAIDWEITDEALKNFIGQVEALTASFEKDKVNQTILKLLKSLGRYLLAHKSMAHPNTIKRIMAVYAALEASVLDQTLTQSDREKLLLEEIRQFKRLKADITPSPERRPTRSESGLSEARETPGIEAIVKAIDDLRSLVASELSAIRKEMAQYRNR